MPLLKCESVSMVSHRLALLQLELSGEQLRKSTTSAPILGLGVAVLVHQLPCPQVRHTAIGVMPYTRAL